LQDSRDPGERTKDGGFYSQKSGGSLVKNVSERGIGLPRPLDLESTSEIRSTKRVRARGGALATDGWDQGAEVGKGAGSGPLDGESRVLV
jgi:hypothetical protein